MRGKANRIRWLLCMLFMLATKQTVFAHNPSPEPSGPPKIIYVDADAAGANDGTSWENAYTFLQDALSDANSAENPVEIRVGQGIYKPDQGSSIIPRRSIIPGDSNATFQLFNDVIIKGGYAGLYEHDPNSRDAVLYETVLSGDLAGNDVPFEELDDIIIESSIADNSYRIVTANAVDNSTILEGFVITGSKNESGSAALYISENSNIIVRNCIFTRNATSGVVCENSSPTLTDCSFEKNIKLGFSGGLCISGGSPQITGCNFSNNVSWTGAGLCSYDAFLWLEDCIFMHNKVVSSGYRCPNPGGTGGALYCCDNVSGSTIKSCLFYENTAISGGAVYLGSCALTIPTDNPVIDKEILVFDCRFVRNRANYGGALSQVLYTIRIEDSVFYENSAFYKGGCVLNTCGRISLNNCFLGGNSSDSLGAVAFNHGILFSQNPTCYYFDLNFTNCTLVDNRAPFGRLAACRSEGSAEFDNLQISNCIISNEGNEIYNPDGSQITINYTNLLGGANSIDDPFNTVIWGIGNIDENPLFVDPGYWDPNGTADDPNDDFWIDGDYHLKSQAGRWDTISESWVIDDVTSPCIDAGDPNSPVAFEPFPNGGVINMGAYGGSSQASKSPSGIHAKYGGSGTAEDPYLIYTAEQMNAIGAEPNDWDKHFKLMADIDLSDYTGAEFNIIGISNRNAFSGVFDGNGHAISNFCYYSSNKDYIGLFRYVSERSAQIKDLGLIAPIILAGTGSYVGSLAGSVSSGTITNCYVEGGSVAGKKKIGGLVGYNQGSLKDCSSTCNVSGDEEVAGLLGHNSGEISDCHAGGEIFGLQNVGGLVGNSSGTINNSYAMGTVGGGGNTIGGFVGSNYGLLLSCSAGSEVYGNIQVGGLVGESSDLIVDCYATGGVSGTKNVGGLVGRTYASIINCYAIGSVSGTTNVGGLVGEGLENYISYGEAINSFWDIETSGQLTSAGGTGKTTVQMQNTGTFMDAGWDFVDATDGPGDIWAEPDGGGYPVLCWQLTPLPQLPVFSGGTGGPDDPYLITTAEELNSIGHNPRLMSAHFQLINDIDLAGMNFFIIGSQWYPFSGTFDGNGRTLSNFSYTSPEATGVGFFGYVVGGQIKDLGLIDSYISIDRGLFHGGLVGYFEGGTITNCYVEDCRISGNDFAGGLVGISSAELNRSGTITNCYVRGSVSGDDDVGGLVGSNIGTITDCYSIADVNGSERVGGLIGTGNNFSFGHGGRIGSRIEKCYAASRMSGDEYVGGLAGQNNGEIILSFWNNETSGQLSISDGNGRTTAEMQTAGTFLDAGWDFIDETENGTEDIWWILEGQDYPRLWWETTENPMLNN